MKTIAEAEKWFAVLTVEEQTQVLDHLFDFFRARGRVMPAAPMLGRPCQLRLGPHKRQDGKRTRWTCETHWQDVLADPYDRPECCGAARQ